MKKLRYWLVSCLLTREEKDLLEELRFEKLNKSPTLAVMGLWIDRKNIERDERMLIDLRSAFE